MCKSMRKVRDKFNYFADPHTFVALAGAENWAIGSTVSTRPYQPLFWQRLRLASLRSRLPRRTGRGRLERIQREVLSGESSRIYGQRRGSPFHLHEHRRGTIGQNQNRLGSSSMPACRKTCCHAILEEEHGGGLASRF